MAAPIGSQILGEVLPYLEVRKENEKEEDKKREIEVPNIVGMTVAEARKTLKELKLNLEVNLNNGEKIDERETIVTEQLPVKGIKIYEEGNIIAKIK